MVHADARGLDQLDGHSSDITPPHPGSGITIACSTISVCDVMCRFIPSHARAHPDRDQQSTGRTQRNDAPSWHRREVSNGSPTDKTHDESGCLVEHA